MLLSLNFDALVFPTEVFFPGKDALVFPTEFFFPGKDALAQLIILDAIISHNKFLSCISIF